MIQTITLLFARLKVFFFAFAVLTLTQCTQPLSMMEGSQIDELGVCLYFAPNVPPEFQEQFEDSLDAYIQKYNNEPHAFKLAECKNSSSLQIRVEEVQYTTQEQRATGIAVSTLGLIGLPATLIASGVPIVAWFYYIPQNTTLATTAFTSDIAHPTLGTLSKSFNTGGIFGNDAKQRERHAKKFNNHLNQLFTEVERSYRKTSSKVPRLTAQNNSTETTVTETK